MSDYSPPYTERDAALDKRRDKVMAALEETKLKNLTVGELFEIMGLFETHTNKFYKSRLFTRDLDQIERILWEARDA